MAARKIVLLFAAICFHAWLLTRPATAAEAAPNSSTNLPTFEVSVLREVVGDLPPASRAYMTAGTNKFAFLVPAGFRVDGTSQEKLLLVGADHDCFITVRIPGPAVAAAMELDPAHYREVLLDRYSGGTILEEFSLTAASRSGPAFELQRTIKGGAKECARVAFIPSAAGVLEFSVVANPEKFQEAKYAFNTLLITFRASEGGKLEVPPLSDKI